MKRSLTHRCNQGIALSLLALFALLASGAHAQEPAATILKGQG